MFAQQNVSIERSKKDEPLTEYDPDLIGFDWRNTRCVRTSTLRKDALKGRPPLPESKEREARVLAHKRRVQMEMAQGAE